MWPPAIGLSVAVVAILVLMFAGSSPLLGRLEGITLDARLWLRPAHAPESRIVVLAIDDASIDRIGRWPWPRGVFAQALDRLHAASAALVAFDLLFTEPDTAADDAALEGAVAADGPVLLPFAIDRQAGRPTPPWLARFEYGRVAGDPRAVPAALGWRLPLPAFGAVATSLAHVSLVPDATGAFRTDLAVLRIGDALLPSFALEAVRMFRGIPRQNVVVRPGEEIDLGALRLPTDPATRILVDSDPPSRFTVRSFADLLDGKLPPDSLAGRLVLIGATASGLGDRLPTPFDPALPGVVRHASDISGMLDGRVLRHDDLTLACDTLLILLACLSIGIAGRHTGRPALLTAGAMLVSLPMLDIAVFDIAGWWLNVTIPLLAVLATTLAAMLLHRRRGSAELRTLRVAAHQDALTGLANRAAVEGWLATPRDTRQLVCACDLDGFKQVNDTLGHPAGDALLREVAARLRRAMRPRDRAFRLGGDEFLLLLQAPTARDDEAALGIAREAFKLVSGPYSLNGKPAAVGMSLGIAAWPDDDASKAQAFSLADAALYAAKKAGKRRMYRSKGTEAPELLPV